MDNLCIDLKHKTVEYEINEKQEPILKFYSGKSTAYIMHDETLEKFNNIISKRSDEETDVTQFIQTIIESQSKQMKSKMSETQIEMKTNMNLLIDHINYQNAKLDNELLELKQMIHKLVTKNDV